MLMFIGKTYTLDASIYIYIFIYAQRSSVFHTIFPLIVELHARGCVGECVFMREIGRYARRRQYENRQNCFRDLRAAVNFMGKSIISM